MDHGAAFRRHREGLYRYVHRLTGDPELADEVVQEAFFRLLGVSLDDEDGVRSWLYTVATNLVRDEARARARRGRLLEETPPSPARPERPDEALEAAERRALARAALERIPERDREMLLMREEGFRYAEIAAVVGVQASSVGTLLARALERFEEALRRIGGMDGGRVRAEAGEG